LVTSNTPAVADPLLTLNRKVPAGSAVGKSATIWALVNETSVKVADSSFTTGAPVAGERLAPSMVIWLVVEFMMALTTVGV
jgi:hypothetical protein